MDEFQPTMPGLSKPVIVALYSPTPGHGKSAAAAALARERGFVILKFAAILKAMLTTLLKEQGATDAEVLEYTEGSLKDGPCQFLNGKTARQAMVGIGSDFGRAMLGNRYWADAAMRQAEAHLKAGRSVVFDDMRFPEELAAVHDAGGTSVEVLASVSRRVSSAVAADGLLEPYEMDHIILNDGSLSELTSKAVRMADALTGRIPPESAGK